MCARVVFIFSADFPDLSVTVHLAISSACFAPARRFTDQQVRHSFFLDKHEALGDSHLGLPVWLPDPSPPLTGRMQVDQLVEVDRLPRPPGRWWAHPQRHAPPSVARLLIYAVAVLFSK